MATKIKKQKTIKTKPSDIFFLAIVTFFLMLTEPILNALFNNRGFWWAIALRAICIVIWVFGIKAIINTARTECNFDALKKESAPSLLQWIITAIVAVAVIGYFVWNKHGIIALSITGLTSLRNIVAFVSMVLLNAFKAAVITLLMVFVQKGFSLSFKAGKYIPFGGIALGLIWAITYILSISDIWTSGMGFNWTYAVYQFAYGVGTGAFLVTVGNKTKYAFPFILATVLLIFIS